VGNPVAAPIPVAPVVVRVRGVNAVLTQIFGFAGAVPAVLAGVTIMVPVAGVVTQPPVNGIE
jgi:hypothetical protein